ncbi:MAG: hypothetical protein ACRCTD_11050 [Beijerinckiaceae bacterium]
MRVSTATATATGTDAAGVSRLDVCALSMVRRVAAMLDLDPDHFQDGAPLPRGWHFFMLAGDTPRSQLRQDGFPGFGLPMPELGLPRLLLGGRTVTYHCDILIGSALERTSKIERLEQKQSPSGPRAIITLCHELRPVSQSTAAITETQTYILLPAGNSAGDKAQAVSQRQGQKSITPDQTLLFMYSALGFNSHKIHLDQNYAQTEEGLPQLVVNGGLVTLLATEFLRNDFGIIPHSLKTRHMAPLYCGRPMTFDLRCDGTATAVIVQDNAGHTAMEMLVEAT